MINKINLDSRIDHLSEKDINELMVRYYNDENVDELLKTYKININNSRLYTLFPPMILENQSCSKCGSVLIKKRKSKSSNSTKEEIYCSKCEHINKVGCSCNFCSEERVNLEKNRLAETELLNKKKKEIIEDILKINRETIIDIDGLTLKDRVYLGALLRTSLSEDTKNIKSMYNIEFKLSPSINYNLKILRHLTDKKIINVSPESNLEYVEINEDKSITYNLLGVDYNINLDIYSDYSLNILNLMNPKNIEFDKHESLELWREIALEEVLEIFNYEMKKTKFNFNPGEKTIIVFNELLNNYSVGQIYNIIWRQIANVTKWYQEGKITKIHAANSVIGRCQTSGERAINEKWDIKNYGRTNKCKQSMISEILFDGVLGIGKLGFEMVPEEV